MKKSVLLLLAAAVFVFAAAPTYKVVNKIKIGGAGRWDYSFSDSANHRLYVSHQAQVEVVDTATDKVVGTIMGTNGVHGIAVANDLGRGFISDGGDNDVTVFDLKTLAVITKVKTGQNPDSIIYEPVTHLVYTFNGRSSDATAIDAKAGSVIAASIPLGGKPEFAQVDGKGNIYANVEDKNEIIVVNAKDKLVARRYSIAPCDSPSGLAIDPKGRLYSVCENKLMIVSDPAAGKVLAQVAIGAGDDGVAFDDGYAFAANGGDGTITMVGETAPGKFEAVATITSQRSARTIASDQRTHKLYLPAAEFGPPTAGKDGKKARPQALPDSFTVLVVGR
ncbi:MAG TPA: YncE family protein [Bryobacteraceae bacterium]|nr:YncE family protein [Bryobacteraceae bacterium]